MGIFSIEPAPPRADQRGSCKDCKKTFKGALVVGEREKPSLASPIVRCVSCTNKRADAVNAQRALEAEASDTDA